MEIGAIGLSLLMIKKRISKKDWLHFHGFTTNPFEGLQAETEVASHRELMMLSFVEPRGFESILGSMTSLQNTLIFAEAGMGKTICRLMADYYYRRSELFRKNKKHVLSVPHTFLTYVLSLAYKQAEESARITNLETKKNESNKITQPKEEVIPQVHLSHHLFEIMSRAIVSLVELIRTEPSLYPKFAGASKEEKSYLSDLIASFGLYLDFSQISFLKNLGIHITQPTNPKVRAKDGLPVLLNSTEQDLFWLLRSLEIFVRWLRDLGFTQVYIQVDGIDKVEHTATNCLVAMDILRPLLLNLSMLNQTYGLVFKLFLPAELKSFVLLDYHNNQIVNGDLIDLNWRKDDLLHILRERLIAYKGDPHQDRTATSFDLFCTPDLRGRIENDLIKVSGNNPRKMLATCAALLNVHCSKEHAQEQLYWLTVEDWNAVRKQQQIFAASTNELNGTPTTSDQLLELISRNENSKLEFKSSARLDVELKRVNKTLVIVIAKTIVGMMNSNGGTLLIGVNDDGQVLGIEQDMSTVTPCTLDAYERFLIDSSKNYIGLEHMGFVQFGFVEVKERTVCVVTILKAAEPVFMKSIHMNEFWVRVGNSTRSLSPRETHVYISQHWKTQ